MFRLGYSTCQKEGAFWNATEIGVHRRLEGGIGVIRRSDWVGFVCTIVGAMCHRKNSVYALFNILAFACQQRQTAIVHRNKRLLPGSPLECG